MVGTVDLVDLIFPGSYTKIVKVSSPEVSYIMWELYPKNWFKKKHTETKIDSPYEAQVTESGVSDTVSLFFSF